MQTVEYFQKHQSLLKQIIKDVGTPVFITDRLALEQKVKKIKNTFGSKCLLYYAVKANFNPSIIKALKDAGIDGIETISPYEIKLAKKMGFKDSEILFTGNNSSTEELDEAKESGVVVNIGSISELKYYASKTRGVKFQSESIQVLVMENLNR
jgi:diaminopimelate decarboxylase